MWHFFWRGIFNRTAVRRLSSNASIAPFGTNAPVPIPCREILLTSSIIDSIFDQLRDRGPEQLAAGRAQADIDDRTTSELQYLSHKALC
jgi:hypothetical protein